MRAGAEAEKRPWLKSPEGDFAPAVVADGQYRRPAKVEVVAVPDVGLKNPPAADELAVSRRHPFASPFRPLP